jgi:hypothetical protein
MRNGARMDWLSASMLPEMAAELERDAVVREVRQRTERRSGAHTREDGLWTSNADVDNAGTLQSHDRPAEPVRRPSSLPVMRTPVDNVLRLVLASPGGINRAVCGPDCASRWLFVTTGLGETPQGELRHVELPLTSCAHCSWCGKQVVAVPACCSCVKGCPAWAPQVTETYRAGVVLLQQRTGILELPARCWAYLDDVCAHLRGTTAFTAGELAVRVWDRRVDWNR